VTPRDHGLECDDLDGLQGGEPADNATRVERLLDGGGAAVERCAVVLNAGAALFVAGKGWTLAEAIERARDALEDGAGARAVRCAVLLNAAAGLYVAGAADTFGGAVELAERAVRNGAARGTLERLRRAAPRTVSTSG
jgi:anthranilate phosphoribosyltransferase